MVSRSSCVKKGGGNGCGGRGRKKEGLERQARPYCTGGKRILRQPQSKKRLGKSARGKEDGKGGMLQAIEEIAASKGWFRTAEEKEKKEFQ